MAFFSKIKTSTLEKTLEEKNKLATIPKPPNHLAVNYDSPIGGGWITTNLAAEREREARIAHESLPCPKTLPACCEACQLPAAWEDFFGALRCFECDPPPMRTCIKAGWWVLTENGDREKLRWGKIPEGHMPKKFVKSN